MVSNTLNDVHPENPLQQYRSDYELQGELVVRLPTGSGRLRCKAIRVGIRTIFQMNLGRRRKEDDAHLESKAKAELADRNVHLGRDAWQEVGEAKSRQQTIFERKVEIIGGDHQGVFLEEGIQR